MLDKYIYSVIIFHERLEVVSGLKNSDALVGQEGFAMFIQLVRFRKNEEGKLCGFFEDAEALPVGKKAEAIEDGQVWACEIRKFHQVRGQRLVDVKPLGLLDLSTPMVFRQGIHPKTGNLQWERVLHMTALTKVLLVLRREEHPHDSADTKEIRIMCDPIRPLGFRHRPETGEREFVLLVGDKNFVQAKKSVELKLAG